MDRSQSRTFICRLKLKCCNVLITIRSNITDRNATIRFSSLHKCCHISIFSCFRYEKSRISNMVADKIKVIHRLFMSLLRIQIIGK